jgi:hypothetical protein
LSEEKKRIVKGILERFSWLSYEYYPLHMPDSIKKNTLAERMENI